MFFEASLESATIGIFQSAITMELVFTKAPNVYYFALVLLLLVSEICNIGCINLKYTFVAVHLLVVVQLTSVDHLFIWPYRHFKNFATSFIIFKLAIISCYSQLSLTFELAIPMPKIIFEFSLIMKGGMIFFNKTILPLTSFLVLIDLPFVFVTVAEVNYRTLRA